MRIHREVGEPGVWIVWSWRSAVIDQIAAAPISWGVCEVPDWGVQLPPERVLSEMAKLGFTQTEAGAAGYLPDDPRELATALEVHGLSLLGGFVPLVLHEPQTCTTSPRPKDGIQPSVTENRKIIPNAVRNTGIDIPITLIAMVNLLNQ